MKKQTWLIVLALVLILGTGLLIYSRMVWETTYVGILPGADCAGLKTELTLYSNNTYFLRETYLATRDGDKIYNSSGNWEKIKSGDRTIIQLKYDNPQEVYNFCQKDADHLLVVDKDLREIPIPTNVNLSLTKKKL